MSASLLSFRSSLVTISTCRSLLGKDEDFVLNQILCGELKYAFNTARRNARRAEARVLVLSLLDLLHGTKSQPERLEDVFSYAVPGVMKDGAIRGTSICRLWTINEGHVANLVADGDLALARPLEYRKAPRWVTVMSARSFLRCRRLP